MSGKAKVTVSGPDLDVKVDSPALGISRATTAANAATMRGDEATYYVRDELGVVVGHAISDGQGNVTINGDASQAR